MRKMHVCMYVRKIKQEILVKINHLQMHVLILHFYIIMDIMHSVSKVVLSYITKPLSVTV